MSATTYVLWRNKKKKSIFFLLKNALLKSVVNIGFLGSVEYIDPFRRYGKRKLI